MKGNEGSTIDFFSYFFSLRLCVLHRPPLKMKVSGASSMSSEVVSLLSAIRTRKFEFLYNLYDMPTPLLQQQQQEQQQLRLQ